MPPPHGGPTKLQNPQALKVFNGPSGLEFDHAPESFQAKGVRGVVEGYSDTAPICIVEIVPMASLLSLQPEAVGFKGIDDLTRRQ
jgi:hypothetical protein